MEADVWIKQNYSEYPNGFKSIDKITLGGQEIKKLAKHLGQDERKQDYVQVIQQFAGDKVNILLSMGSCSSKPTTMCEICMGLLKADKPMCNCAK
jgi:hypothetical protein